MSLTGKRNIPLMERFWLQTDKKGKHQCWNWTGGVNGKKRPMISVNGKQVYAHRFSYSQFVGEIPDKALVCHTCDNIACVNPNHLFVGTQDDNMKDMAQKDRSYKPRGEINPKSVLTEADVLYIRANSKGRSKEFGARPMSLKFGVSPDQIMMVASRRQWKHI